MRIRQCSVNKCNSRETFTLSEYFISCSAMIKIKENLKTSSQYIGLPNAYIF